MTNEHLRQVNNGIEEIGLENIRNIILITNNATNGDVIKGTFPNGYFLNGNEVFATKSAEKFYLDADVDNLSHMMVSKNWWNSPYKENTDE